MTTHGVLPSMNTAADRAWRWPALAVRRLPPAWTIAYLVLVAAGLVARPLLPVDETRYIGVAWEMWSQRQWWVPHLNGEPYGHKPPLLFWLIHLGWFVGGVSELWPRLLGPILALLCGWQLSRLASALWPTRPNARRMAPLLFLGSGYVAVQSTALGFDLLLLSGLLGAWTALWHAAQGKRGAWPWYSVGLGVALLAKGPVALVYVLPAWLMAPSWRGPDGWTWSVRGLLGLVFAAALPLAWVYAVARQQPAEFVGELLFDQASQRISGAIGHGRPWWWYLPLLPAAALPWLAWPTLWRALRVPAQVRDENGWRFALCIAVSGLVLLSLIGGKQIHYLLPVLAAAALLAARAVCEQRAAPARALPLAVFGWFVIGELLLAFGLILRPAYDLREFSRRLGEAQRQGGRWRWSPASTTASSAITADSRRRWRCCVQPRSRTGDGGIPKD